MEKLSAVEIWCSVGSEEKQEIQVLFHLIFFRSFNQSVPLYYYHSFSCFLDGHSPALRGDGCLCTFIYLAQRHKVTEVIAT